MKKIVCVLLMTLLLCNIGFCKETKSYASKTKGKAASESSHDAVTISMAIWGVGLVVGIGVLAAILDQSTAHSH